MLAGFMGAGKTTVGTRVAARAGARFVDLDSMVESMRGERIEDVFMQLGEPRFRVLEAQLVPIALQPGVVVALGGGTLQTRETLELVRKEAHGVWLDAPIEVLWERIQRSGPRPLATARSPEEMAVLLESRVAAYSLMHDRVDAADSLEHVSEQVLLRWTG